MKKKKQRLISTVLALSFTAALIPQTVFASSDEAAVQGDAQTITEEYPFALTPEFAETETEEEEPEDKPENVTSLDLFLPSDEFFESTLNTEDTNSEINSEINTVDSDQNTNVSLMATLTYDDFTYTINDDNTITITDYTGSAESLDIPSEIDGMSVTSIGQSSFRDCTSLTTVTIPDSVTSIGNAVFTNCTKLESITLSDSLVSIGNSTFANCINLQTIIIPDSVTSIDYSTFSGCESLISVKLPNGLTEIDDMLFSGCTSLEEFIIPDSVKRIGYWAFQNCTALSHVVIPETTTRVGDYYRNAVAPAFEGCKNLKTAGVIGSGCDIEFGWTDGIPSFALGGCGVEEVTLLQGMEYIGERSFSGCTGLRSITIPNSVTDIARYAFSGCENLTSITIPDGITNIRENTFSGCKSLTSITIPDSVTTIGYSAFEGCVGLTSITIPDGVTGIDHEAFQRCTELTSITIPYSVKLIGYEAFEGCKNLTSITMPGSVTTIGYSAFEGCVGLTSVTIDDGVQSIGTDAFSGCENLTSITIPNSVTIIRERTFYGCSALASITIPDSVTTIGDSAFEGCFALTSITISKGVTSIGTDAFYRCINLTNITVPDSVTSIGNGAFDDCSNELILYVIPGSYAEECAIENEIKYEYIITDNIEVKVTAEDGTELTSGYTVNWYETGNDTVIATGNRLHNADEAKEYEYEVILGEELSKIYYQPERQPAEDKQNNCALEKIPFVTVKGMITDSSKTALDNVNVKFMQTVNGFTNEVSAVSNSDGSFTAEILNVPTVIRLSSGKYYNVTKTIIADKYAGTELDLGAFAMAELPRNKIVVTIYLQKAAVDGEEGAVSLITNAGNIDFSLYNKTNSSDITDFTVQYPNIIIEGGADASDEIEISASDTQNNMTAESTTLTLDKDCTGEAEIRFTENGKLSASLQGVTDVLMLIFDRNGKFVGKKTSSDSYIASDNLSDGIYKVIFIKKTNLLSNVSSVDKLAEYGLKQDEDYSVRDVEIKNGVITELGNISVPDFDESRLYYTDNNFTGVTANKSSVSAGNLVMIRAEYKIEDKYSTSEERLTLELPESVQLMDGSVTLNGKTVNYSFTDNVLSVNTNGGSGTVRCYVIPELEDEYSINGSLSFVHEGGRVTQPIGTAYFTAEAMTITAPSKTGNTEITVSGKTRPKSIVTVFDNDIEVGKVTANSVGSWSLKFNLVKPYSFSYHSIQAKIDNDLYETGIMTERTSTLYNKNYLQISKITMYNTAHPGVNPTPIEYATEFDFSNPISAKAYRYWPSYPTFTFKMEFDGDASALSDVYVITTDSSGAETYIKCEYSRENNQWIGVHDYNNSTVPIMVAASYNDSGEEKFEYSLERYTEMSDEINTLWTDVEGYADDVEFNVITQTDDYAVLSMIDSATSTELGKTAAITVDYALVDVTNEAFEAITDDEDNTQYLACARYDENFIAMIVADTEEEAAVGYMIYSPGSVEDETESEAAVSLFKASNKGQATKIFKSVVEDLNIKDAMTSAGENILADIIDGGEQNYMQDISNTTEENVPSLSALLNSVRYFQLLDRVKDIRSEMDGLFESAPQYVTAKCKDGSYKLSNADMETASNLINMWQEKYEQDCAYLEERVDLFRHTIIKAATIELATFAADKAWKFCKGKKNGRENNLSNKFLNKHFGVNAKGAKKIRDRIHSIDDTLENIESIKDSVQEEIDYYNLFADSLGIPNTERMGEEIYEAIPDEITNLYDDVNYSVETWLNKYAADAEALWQIVEGTYNGIMLQHDQSIAWITEHYKDCDEDPEDPDDEDGIKPNATTPSIPTSIIWDPSGYVCEAVPSNRIEGVTTTAYYLGDELDDFGEPTGNKIPYVWDASDYDQVNPLITDANGEYAWDVPQGQWQVKYEKEGYKTAYSEWLPVPPPQMEVHVALVSTANPEVKSVNAYTTRLRIEFSRYMDISSVNTDNVTVTVDGVSVSGTITPLNNESSFEDPSVEYASIFTFVPDNEISSEAAVDINNVVAYNGKALTEAYHTTVPIEYEPQSIEVQETASVAYSGETLITLQILPAEAGTNKNISITSSSPSIVSASAETVTTNENGNATFAVNGNLPGSGEISFALEGTDITAATSVTVGSVSQGSTEACQKVTASIESGTAVEKGTKVTLSTETEGAEIYYTLDKTCPCVVDSESRIKYTEPISIDEDTYIIAYAVKDGFEDSPTVGFSYTIKAADTPATSKPSSGSGGGGGVSTYTVTFETQGGSKVEVVKVTSGRTAAKPADPTKEGYTFGGWFTDKECTAEYDFDSKITKNITLYAKWTETEPTATAVPSNNKENPFTDVKETDWFYDDVIYSYKNKLMNGVTDTEFSPNTDITRAMFVTVIYRMENEPDAGTAAFADVAENEYYSKAVSWANANGIVEGFSDTEFRPNDSITREQMAAIAQRYAKFKGYDTTVSGSLGYYDADNISDYAKDAVIWAADNEIMLGDDSNNFTPQITATRAQAAAVFQRIIENLS